MSTAFRNFIITFALAAVLFAIVGSLVVSGVLDGMFKEKEAVSSESKDYSYGNETSYYKGETSDSSQELPTSEDYGDAYLIFFEDHKRELVGAKIICANNDRTSYIYDNLPINGNIYVNNFLRTVKDAYSSNGEEFICKKFEYIFGISFDGYMVFSPKSIQNLITQTSILTKYGMDLRCVLPYEIKYEDPEMKEWNELYPDDKQYKTLIGDTVITAENASYIFSQIPDDIQGSKDASEMFGQIFNSLSNLLFANQTLKNSSSDINALMGAFEKCTISSENIVDVFNAHSGNKFPALSGLDNKELSYDRLHEPLENILKNNE